MLRGIRKSTKSFRALSRVPHAAEKNVLDTRAERVVYFKGWGARKGRMYYNTETYIGSARPDQGRFPRGSPSW